MHFQVGVLGATGAVGQTFIRLLNEHPWFEITALAASERSAGRPYREVTGWIGDTPMPESIAGMTVQKCTPEALSNDCDFVFSGLDSSVAGDIERAFAEAGFPVISNAKNYRMQPDVPLLIPEINPNHAALIEQQTWGKAEGNGAPGNGFIVTNPNCSVVGLVCALKPLHDAFGLSAIQVTTMQALSGAGYPGVPALDALGNAIPYLGNEEEKMAREPLKILGALSEDTITPADFPISAQCNRIPVIDGHLETVSVKLKTEAVPEDIIDVLRSFRPATAEMSLPTAPDAFIHVFEEAHFPQPRRHAGLGGGMTVSVGRVRTCSVLDIKMVVLSHNTVRGAAGGALLNAELLAKKGYLTTRVRAAEA